jgi:ankyrin repeat protein
MTTPLHEAARLGAGDFLLLANGNGGDPNVKNGYARTALQLCSGGVTVEEE